MAQRNLLVPPPMWSATNHYGTLEGGHRTHTRLGLSPQLNRRLPTISRELPKLRNDNDRPGHSKYPIGTIFSTSTSTYHRGELKPMQPMQWARTQEVFKVLHSQIPPKQLMLWRNKRGRTRKNTKSFQYLDPQASPH